MSTPFEADDELLLFTDGILEATGPDGQEFGLKSAEDIEWIIPGEDWPLAGMHRGHAGLENLLQKVNETVETSFPEPPEFIAQGDRVLVIGFATGRIKATNRTFEDHGSSPLPFEMAK